MSRLPRREFLRTAGVAAGAVFSAPTLADNTPSGDSNMSSRPIPEEHKRRPLPFDPARLNGLSERMLRSHWENNYGGSVKALNTIRQKLSQALGDKELPPFVYNDLKREHLMRTGSVVLHELYFENLGGDGNADAQSRKRIGAAFGDFHTWETEFRRIAAGLGGGSGWVLLGYNRHTGLIENYWLADHLHGPTDTVPLLVMDMYEHSYQIDYGAAAAKYIDAFFRNIRWDAVAARIERAGIAAQAAP
jgi:Fe-Mn family superoxide dismutase